MHCCKKYSFYHRTGMFFHSLVNMTVTKTCARDAKPLLCHLALTVKYLYMAICEDRRVTSFWT